MAKFNVSVDHEKERDEVVEKLKGFSQLIREKMPTEVSDVEEEWDDNGNMAFSFKAMGFKIAGKVVASADSVTVQGDLPFAALPFRGALESKVEEKIREAIS